MFEANFPQASVFKKIIESVKEIVSNVNFNFSETGLTIVAMDPCNSCLIHVTLRSDAFREYNCTHASSVGLSIETLSKIIKTAGASDSITLREAVDGDFITIVLKDDSEQRIGSFNVRLMNIDSVNFCPPEDSTFDSNVSLPSAEFARIVRDFSQLGDSATIRVNKDGIEVFTNGEGTTGSVVMHAGGAADGPVINDCKTASEGAFLMKYLSKITKSAALSSNVNICLSSDKPATFSFPITDGADEIGAIKYVLASTDAASGDYQGDDM